MQSVFNIIPSYIKTLKRSGADGSLLCKKRQFGSSDLGKWCTAFTTCWSLAKLLPPSFFVFHFREELVIRGSQIRRIEWVFDKLESTLLDSSHGHRWHINRCILLMQEHSRCQLSTANQLAFQKISIVGSCGSTPNAFLLHLIKGGRHLAYNIFG